MVRKKSSLLWAMWWNSILKQYNCTNLSWICVVESLYKLNHGTLSTTTVTHQSHCLSRLNSNTEFFQHLQTTEESCQAKSRLKGTEYTFLCKFYIIFSQGWQLWWHFIYFLVHLTCYKKKFILKKKEFVPMWRGGRLVGTIITQMMLKNVIIFFVSNE